jgi:DNA-binding response OmpR family regulator
MLVDLMMPRMNGEELVRALRADDSRIPVVILSGDIRARHKAGELGAAAVLIKPIDLDELLSVVRKIVVPCARESGSAPRTIVATAKP